MSYALHTSRISKQFPQVLANDQVDFTLRKGEIHALLGANGAGKTTLMNILYGLCQPDQGEIYLDGIRTRLDTPHEAISHGIGMVHQHFMLVEPLTVVENIMLGQETVSPGTQFLGQFGFLNRKQASGRIRALSHQYGLEVDPHARVQDLSTGEQQRVEILKALYREADLLILDEPTSVLSPREVDDLFVVMRTMVFQGKSIIFITHKLQEVFSVADRISVMREGRLVATLNPAEAAPQMLSEMMMGQQVPLKRERKAANPGPVVLSVENLAVQDARKNLAVGGVSLQVRSGEIIGVAGVHGNGQTELVEALTGLRQPLRGKVFLSGNEITHVSPRRKADSGVGHIPEHRYKHGLVLSFSVQDNLFLSTYHIPPYRHGIVLDLDEIALQAQSLIEAFNIRPSKLHKPAGELSGGNQQKIIIAREFSRLSGEQSSLRLLVANQPTRGLDVAGLEYVHRRLLSARDQGAAVLLVSTDLDEILALSDRIIVLFKGRIAGELDVQNATRERIGFLMGGGRLTEDG